MFKLFLGAMTFLCIFTAQVGPGDKYTVDGQGCVCVDIYK
jgi:hypothetical protein